MRAIHRKCLTAAAIIALGAPAWTTPAAAQSTPRLDARLGYLATGGDSFSDRPFIQLDGVLELGRPTGGGPALGVSAGFVAEFGDVFAASMTTSFRWLAGLEAAWPLGGETGGAAASAEFVPSLQAGYMSTGGQDERSGFTLRAGPAIRIPIGTSSGKLLTFEPVSVVVLPAPDSPVEDEGTLAWEFGVLKVGFRF